MRIDRLRTFALVALCAMGLGCDIEDPAGGGEGGAGGVVGAGGEGGSGAAGGEGGSGAAGGEGGAGAAGGEGGAGAAGGEGGAGAAGGEGGAGAAGGEGGAGAAGGEGGAGAAGGEGGAGAAGGAGGAGAAGGEGGAGAAGGAGGAVGCEDVPTIEPDDPMYDRYEGIGFDNACRTDDDCFASGCSGEVCAAEQVPTTCEVVPAPEGGCGCVQGECVWHVEECGCPDADGDGVCDASDFGCNADGGPLLCRQAAPECREGTVPEIRDGCYTDRCVTWEQCGEEPPCPDADGDGVCDADDNNCNADGGPLLCRRAAPECREGTVPEIRDGCYTDRCVTWDQCGEEPCPDADGDGICDADDSDCNADDVPLMCRRAVPECREGTVPEIRNGCYTDRCVTWDQCGAPCPDADGDGVCDADDRYCGLNEVLCDMVEPNCERGGVPEVEGGCFTGRCVTWDQCDPDCEDSDDDGRCDQDDNECNADGTELRCLRPVPLCREGTVPEIRDGCYTDRCVTWDQCGAPCPDADGDGVCDADDRYCGPNEVLCDALEPNCERGGVPEVEGGCFTGRCVTWDQCGADPEPQACGGIAGLRCDRGQVCVDDPTDDCNPERGGADCGGICVDEERLCTPVRDGEFGLCEAVIGYAMTERGVCAAVSGCGCDAGCAGRVFPSQRACETQCAGPMCEADADDDNICDADDSACNADGTSLMCRQAAPECRRGTVPEIREGCYTDRCVTWAECGAPACEDSDDDGVCDTDDLDCNADGTPLMCRRARPVCRERGTVPEIREGCYTDRCVTWDQCGGPVVEACAPIEPGEFGFCRAIIGWGIQAATGQCGIISGCGCDERCEGRVFESEEACQASCEERAEPQMCGGFGGFRCRAANQTCVDDPRDDCAPPQGADCSGVCIDDDRVCAPVRQGEFGDCDAIIGWAPGERGCVQVSGCGCDIDCAGRVFADQRTCEAACLARE